MIVVVTWLSPIDQVYLKLCTAVWVSLHRDYPSVTQDRIGNRTTGDGPGTQCRKYKLTMGRVYNCGRAYLLYLGCTIISTSTPCKILWCARLQTFVTSTKKNFPEATYVYIWELVNVEYLWNKWALSAAAQSHTSHRSSYSGSVQILILRVSAEV